MIAASDVLGDSTLDVIFAPKRFVEANPRTMQVFLTALDEANDFIAKDPLAAAQAFNRVTRTTASDADVVKMIADPDSRFSATPHGVMEYARFMHAVGSVRVKPESWKDLFITALHDRQGS